MTNPTAAPDIGLTTETDAGQPGCPSSLRRDWPTSAHGDAGGTTSDEPPSGPEHDEPSAGSADALKNCPNHSGKTNRGRREVYEPIMRKLWENQAGAGRHKCPYCAYLAGEESGRERGRDDFRRELRALLWGPGGDRPA